MEPSTAPIVGAHFKQRRESFSSTIHFELKDCPVINIGTPSNWSPDYGHVTVEHITEGDMKYQRATVHLANRGEPGRASWPYDFGLPRGITRGSGEYPVTSNLLITDLPQVLIEALEELCGISFSDYAQGATYGA